MSSNSEFNLPRFKMYFNKHVLLFFQSIELQNPSPNMLVINVERHLMANVTEIQDELLQTVNNLANMCFTTHVKISSLLEISPCSVIRSR